MTERRTLWETLTCSGHMTARDRKNQWIATGWLLVWAVSFVAASLLLKRGTLPEGAASWAVALLPTLIGVGTILVFRNFLVEADELQRKIQLEALALGFGVGLIGSWGLSLAELAGGPSADPADVTVLMMVVYALSVAIGTRRYA